MTPDTRTHQTLRAVAAGAVLVALVEALLILGAVWPKVPAPVTPAPTPIVTMRP